MRGAGTAVRVAAGCCAAAVPAGCASGTPASQPSARPDYPPAASTASAGDPLALARQAYLGMWQAFLVASRTADYQSTALSHYAAGAALTLLTRGLYQNYKEGLVTRGEPAYDPVVSMVATPAGEPCCRRSPLRSSTESGVSQLPAHNGRTPQRAARLSAHDLVSSRPRRSAAWRCSSTSGTGSAAKIASQAIGPPGAGSSWYRGRT